MPYPCVNALPGQAIPRWWRRAPVGLAVELSSAHLPGGAADVHIS